MSLIHHKELARIRRKFADKKIVFVSGVFDLIHPGHVLFFEDSKRLGDILVVQIGDDASIQKIKGPARPLFNELMRLKMVSSLKPVDYCLLAHETDDIPFGAIKTALGDLRPDIYAVNDDVSDILARSLMAAKYGVKLEILKRVCPPEFDKVSTTKLIEKIKKQA